MAALEPHVTNVANLKVLVDGCHESRVAAVSLLPPVKDAHHLAAVDDGST